jgi:hypothetical protein
MANPNTKYVYNDTFMVASFRVTRDLWSRFGLAAESMNRSKSNLLRTLMEEFLSSAAPTIESVKGSEQRKDAQ